MSNVALLKNSLNQMEPIFGENLDSKFNDIVSLVEREEFQQAVPLIEETFEEGRFDIRLIMYFLYAHFLQAGINSFKEVFTLTHSLLEKNWESLSPVEKKEQQVQNSLNWFFSHAIKRLEYIVKLYRKGESDLWQKYTENMSLEELDEMIVVADQLSQTLTLKWQTSHIHEKHMRLVKGIKEVVFMANQEKDNKQEEPIPIEQTKPVNTKKEKLKQEYASINEISDEILSSEAMKRLLKKLKAFEVLIERGEYIKASVIVDDMAQCLTDFNPLVYLPKLFVNYFSLLAENVSILQRELEDSETIFRNTLEKLYQADLETFIQWRWTEINEG